MVLSVKGATTETATRRNNNKANRNNKNNISSSRSHCSKCGSFSYEPKKKQKKLCQPRAYNMKCSFWFPFSFARLPVVHSQFSLLAAFPFRAGCINLCQLPCSRCCCCCCIRSSPAEPARLAVKWLCLETFRLKLKLKTEFEFLIVE